MHIDPTKAIYHHGSVAEYIQIAAGCLGVIFLVATLIFVCKALRDKKIESVYFALMFWAVIPPVWFWIEYHFLYRCYGVTGTFELFKYGQNVSIAIWAGLTFSLAAIANSDHFKNRSN